MILYSPVKLPQAISRCEASYHCPKDNFTRRQANITGGALPYGVRLTAAALFYEILRLDLVEIVKALVALAEAGKELLQIVPEVDHGDCNAADNDDTADDAQNELQIILHEIDLPY